MNTNPNAVTFDELLESMDSYDGENDETPRHNMRTLAVAVSRKGLTFKTGDTVLQD